MLTVLNKARGTVVCESLQMYLSPGERRSLGDVTPEAMRIRCPELESLESRGHVLLIVEPEPAIEAIQSGVATLTLTQDEQTIVPQASSEPLSEVVAQPKKAKSKSSK